MLTGHMVEWLKIYILAILSSRRLIYFHFSQGGIIQKRTLSWTFRNSISCTYYVGMKSQKLMPTLLYTKAFKIYSCVSGFIVIYTNKKHAIPKCPAFKTLVAFLKSEFTFFMRSRLFCNMHWKNTRQKSHPTEVP